MARYCTSPLLYVRPHASQLLTHQTTVTVFDCAVVVAQWASLPMILQLPLHTDEGPPADGPTPIIVQFPLWALMIVYITIGIGVICAFICLVVTLAYRKHK